MAEEQIPAGGMDDLEEIEKAVEERVEQEAAAYPDTSRNNGKLDSRFVRQCLYANAAERLGDPLF